MYDMHECKGKRRHGPGSYLEMTDHLATMNRGLHETQITELVCLSMAFDLLQYPPTEGYSQSLCFTKRQCPS